MSLIKEKSLEFAVQIVNLCQDVDIQERSFLLDELFMAGTKIGLHVNHAQHAENKAEFVQCFKDALTATTRTQFWLKLLLECDAIHDNDYKTLIGETIGMYNVIRSIIITTKEKHSLN